MEKPRLTPVKKLRTFIDEEYYERTVTCDEAHQALDDLLGELADRDTAVMLWTAIAKRRLQEKRHG